MTWSVLEGAGGTVDAGGLCVAPATGGVYHVTAAAVVDPTKSATTAIAVTEKVLSVTVASSTVGLQPGTGLRFSATVTTTCGAFASVASVPAP